MHIVDLSIGYMLHHDAITGTSRQATIDDYYRRIGTFYNFRVKSLFDCFLTWK